MLLLSDGIFRVQNKIILIHVGTVDLPYTNEMYIIIIIIITPLRGHLDVVGGLTEGMNYD